ncbi:MAG: hypothetical protein KDK39_02930 [Leptospiraceae bacterium]|nr:hypothetical protein [Leptospiraceae bacterium]
MYSKDYLIRLIEQFFHAIAAIIYKIEQRDFAVAQAEIEAAYKRFYGLPAALVHKMTLESVIQFVVDRQESAGQERLRMLAEILAADGELQALRGNEAAASRRSRRALELFHYLDPACDSEQSGTTRRLILNTAGRAAKAEIAPEILKWLNQLEQQDADKNGR